jgi:zinc/manganese transport system substrate-binding protein
MRNSISYLFALIALFSASAAIQARLNVFACEPEWAALTRELAGDQANVFAATRASLDPHHVQAQRLREIDPANKAHYQTNWEHFRAP